MASSRLTSSRLQEIVHSFSGSAKKKSCEKGWGVGEREGGGFFFPPPLSSPDRARLFSFCLPCSVFATSLLFERLAKASSRQDMNALNLMCRRKDYWTEELFM